MKPQAIRRRHLLTAGAAAGVLAASGLSAFAGTRRGGCLRAGLSGANTGDTWDSRTHSDLFMIASAQGAVFDNLTEVRADGTLTGELATHWEATPDARTWTFNLRRGVTFHNGKAFGAGDVIASLQLHGAASPAQPIVGAITGIRKLTDHQVQFTLEAGNADFPYLLSDYHILMYPAGQIEEAMAKGIGTGMYRVSGFEPGVRMTATRVDDHYKDGTAGWFDEIEFIAMNDTTARMNALLAGQVDAINRVDLKDLSHLRANPMIRIQDIAGNQHYTFPMLTNLAPFNDVNVRRALKYAVNRHDMVDKVLLGHGRIGNDTPIGPANQYVAADMAQTPYDPDRARFHLRQAGLASLDVDLSVSGAAFEGAVDAARLYQASAGKAGININVLNEPADGYWSAHWRNTPWCAACWSGRATEDWMFATAYGARVPWNDTRWGTEQNSRFGQLLRSARAELDSDTRRAQYHEMQEILRDDGGVIVPMFANYVQAVSNRVAYPDTVGNLWQMDNARMAERWWMA